MPRVRARAVDAHAPKRHGALHVGQRIGDYVVERVLGEGTLAVVYRVRHAKLGTLGALKVLKDPQSVVVDRLLSEGRALAELRHPNVSRVLEILDVDGAPGLLMEHIDGCTLRELLDQGRLNIRQAAQIGAAIVAGVAASHEKGLVHRDLKPDNIMMAIQGNRMVPKIIDFGLVKVLEPVGADGPITQSGIMLGTPQYMAPEQFDDAATVDARADLFSAGVILYELVTGTRPFDGSLLDVLTLSHDGAYRRITDPTVPIGMKAAIEVALRPERDERIASADLLHRMWSNTPLASGDARFAPVVLDKLRIRKPLELGGAFVPAFTVSADEIPTEVAEITDVMAALGEVGPDFMGSTLDRIPTKSSDSRPLDATAVALVLIVMTALTTSVGALLGAVVVSVVLGLR